VIRVISVLEPSVLHARIDEWREDGFASAFEARWIDLIDVIGDSRKAGLDHDLLTSLALEALVWDGEHCPAWTVDSGARQRLIPLFYQRLMPLMRSVDAIDGSTLSVVPALDARPPQDAWLQSALAILSWAASQPDALIVQVGLDGSVDRVAAIEREGTEARTVPLCHNYTECITGLPLVEAIAGIDSSRLSAILKLSLADFEARNPGRRALYEYAFSDRFCDLFDSVPAAMRRHIVDSLVVRITLPRHEAQAHKGLKDEPLSGRDGWRRMRVTQDWRIHYRDNPHHVIFETVGTHDFDL
jgi:hypothetical protein